MKGIPRTVYMIYSGVQYICNNTKTSSKMRQIEDIYIQPQYPEIKKESRLFTVVTTCCAKQLLTLALHLEVLLSVR